MRYELKSIGIWSVIKVSVFVHLIMGFIVGLLYALMWSFMMSVYSRFGLLPIQEMSFMELPVAGLIVLLPIGFSLGGAVFGTVGAFILALVYNLVAKIVGGLEFRFDDLRPDAIPTTQQPMTAYTAQPAQPPQQTAPPQSYPPPPPPPPDQPQTPSVTPPSRPTDRTAPQQSAPDAPPKSLDKEDDDDEDTLPIR